jgi:hypothetical protein
MLLRNGTTSECVFGPWENYLINKGVEIYKKKIVANLIYDDNKIKSYSLSSEEDVSGDIFISAISNLEFTHLIEKFSAHYPVSITRQKFYGACSNGAQFFLSGLPNHKMKKSHFFLLHHITKRNMRYGEVLMLFYLRFS